MSSYEILMVVLTFALVLIHVIEIMKHNRAGCPIDCFRPMSPVNWSRWAQFTQKIAVLTSK